MSVALASPVVVPAPLKIPRLHPSGLSRADHARSHYQITPSPMVDYAAILQPIYWHHVGSHLRPGDIIEVCPEDRSYWAMLMVTDAGDNRAKVEELIRKQFDTVVDEATMPDGYAIEWRGPNGRYAVVRKVDKNVMQSNFVEKSDAMKWMIDNRKSLVA